MIFSAAAPGSDPRPEKNVEQARLLASLRAQEVSLLRRQQPGYRNSGTLHLCFTMEPAERVQVSKLQGSMASDEAMLVSII